MCNSVILAKGFDILDGRVEITVPWVMDRTDYSLVREYYRFGVMRHSADNPHPVFGDSGNFSPEFTINGPSPF